MGLRCRSFGSVIFLLIAGLISQGFAAARQPWKRRPGVLLYHLKDNATNDQRAAAARLLAASRPMGSMAVPTAKSYRSTAFSTLAPLGGEEELAEALRVSGAVDFAEPDYLMPAAMSTPNDPDYSLQWFHQTINSPGAWSYTTGASILVAVCDTGIDASHGDLAPNLSLPGYNAVDHSADTTPVAPHGTEVAGVIGAVGNNNLGVAGMDWTIKILPVRITNNADTTAWCSDMADGIEWAADHGAQVINLSYETTGCPATIEAASQYAFARGALVFVAAGNSGIDLASQYSTAQTYILVGATDISDRPAPFSNYGAPVRLAAPGANILTTKPGGYASASGTSFSAPLAAGVAALIFSLNPGWTPTIVENLLLATTHSLGAGTMGYGRLDAGAALAAAQNCLAGHCLVPSVLGSNPPSQPNPPSTVTTSGSAAVRAYPNPWRSDRHPGIDMTLDQLLPNSDVRIYTISGRQVRRLASGSGTTTWNLTNDSGERVASGIYLFLAKDLQGQTAHGKIAVIR